MHVSHSMFRQPGTGVVWRSRPQGHVGYVMPVTVVVDTPEVTVLYQAPGSVCKRRAGRRGGPQGRNMFDWSGGYTDRVWDGAANVRLHVWGMSYSIIRTWNWQRDCAEGWYINLEQPWRRTRIGFDTLDLILDVTVADDGTTWAWKDADELAWAVEQGTISNAEAAAIYDAGRQAILALEAQAWPFNANWTQWRPNPLWPIPGLPEGWDDPTPDAAGAAPTP